MDLYIPVLSSLNILELQGVAEIVLRLFPVFTLAIGLVLPHCDSFKYRSWKLSVTRNLQFRVSLLTITLETYVNIRFLKEYNGRLPGDFYWLWLAYAVQVAKFFSFWLPRCSSHLMYFAYLIEWIVYRHALNYYLRYAFWDEEESFLPSIFSLSYVNCGEYSLGKYLRTIPRLISDLIHYVGVPVTWPCILFRITLRDFFFPHPKTDYLLQPCRDSLFLQLMNCVIIIWLPLLPCYALECYSWRVFARSQSSEDGTTRDVRDK